MSGFETFFRAKLSSAQKFRLLGRSLPWDSHNTFWTQGWTHPLPPWAQSSLMDLVTLLPLPLGFGSIHALSGNTQSLLEVNQY